MFQAVLPHQPPQSNINAKKPDILNDPSIQRLGELEDLKAKLGASTAVQLMATKKYGQMNSNERKVCVRHIVANAESEVQLRNQLCDLGLEFFDVDWKEVDQSNQTSREAQALVRALGGLISKSGALVMVTTVDDVV